jgi:AraC family transcriptional regulator of adaptative response/methylated-DNA-[protein]-cysteine methyltransferase
MSEIIELKSYENGTDYRRMARAIAFLSAHYAEQPRLEDAAEAVGLSPFHFQRTFTRYVGVSPKAFVGHLTLAHAKAELANGTSVLNAALEAGLSGPSRLHDLCLKIEAMTPGEYSRGGAGLEIAFGFHDCPFGVALVMTTDKGVCGIAFGDPDDDKEAMLADMKSRWPRATYRENAARTEKIARRIFDPGSPKDELSLHLMGTPWQIQVWQALLAIPEGKFATYGEVANALHRETASRAVGAAVGRNPISYLIPCHRVLGSKGTLTGYHWGVDRKRAMLAIEAARTAQREMPRTSAIA